MKIEKQYVGESTWEESTLDEAIENLEGSGYWKKGTVEGMLDDGITLRNPFCFYRKVKKALRRFQK